MIVGDQIPQPTSDDGRLEPRQWFCLSDAVGSREIVSQRHRHGDQSGLVGTSAPTAALSSAERQRAPAAVVDDRLCRIGGLVAPAVDHQLAAGTGTVQRRGHHRVPVVAGVLRRRVIAADSPVQQRPMM